MMQFNILNAVSCEHIVNGADGKHTLINTQSGDLLVSEFPARIKFALYVEIVPNFNGSNSVNIRAKIEGEEIMRGTASAELTKGQPAVIVIPDSVINFQAPGTLEIEMWIDSQEPVMALQKTVRSSEA